MSVSPPPLPPVLPRKKGLPAVVWVVIALVIVIPLIVVLAFAGFAGGSTAIHRAKKVSTLATAHELENSINQFYFEFGALPEPGSTKMSRDVVFDTSGPEGQQLLSVVMGNEPGPAPQNPKGIQFFIGRSGAGGKGGLIPLPSGLSELRDPWGNPYQVLLDGDYDEVLTPPANSGSSVPVKGRRALVYSLGRDGKGGTEAVRTW